MMDTASFASLRVDTVDKPCKLNLPFIKLFESFF